jgi:hypothetical protein
MVKSKNQHNQKEGVKQGEKEGGFAIQTLLTSVVGVARRFGGARSFCRTEHGRGLRCQGCVGGVSLF